MNQFHRMRDVSKMLGIAKPTLYAHIVKGIFPPGISVGPRAIAWPQSELDAIIGARTAGKSETQIRDLVASLTAARKSAG